MILPNRKIAVEALRPFGHSVLASTPATPLSGEKPATPQKQRPLRAVAIEEITTISVKSPAEGITPARLSVALSMKAKTMKMKAPKRVTVTERSLQNAAARLLPKTKKLVSTEVDYIRRVLGDSATQVEIDEKVITVRKMPWSTLVAE